MDTSGEIVGQHTGIHRYTIGQRRGIGIANERPLYVISIDATKNRVVVGGQDELLSREFTAAGVNWVACDEPAELRCARTCASAIGMLKLQPQSHRLRDGRAQVIFDEPQRAITPGQATVFYHEDEVVGGGWIVKGRQGSRQEAGAGGRGRNTKFSIGHLPIGHLSLVVSMTLVVPIAMTKMATAK